MEHAEIRTVLGQHISSLIAQPGDLPLTLRPYQAETLESTARWLSDPLGTKRAYVNHATGLGKTVLFASMVAAASGMRSLVVVPTKTLLEQTARVIAKFTGGMLGHQSSLSNIQDKDGETVAVRGMNHSAVVLTTDASFNKLAARIRQEFDPHLIIRDECHWGYIGPALAALEQFPEAVIVGFSATPDYLTNTPKGGYVPVKLENGQTLYGPLDRFADTHFQTCLDRRSVRWGIENGWLCPLAWGMIEFDMSLKSIPVVDGPNGPDYDEAKLQELMSKHWSVMCETVRRLYDNPDYDLGSRQAYAICPSVDAAEELARAIGSLGLSTACITGNTPDTERNILLRAYNDHEIRFLSSVMVLREGWDAPDAEVCMMLRPTKSRVLYEQGMGRALRLPENNGHKVALVLDAHFQASKFSPLSAPAIFGKPGEEIPVGGMLIGNGGGMRGGEGIESPFLPKNAKPKLVVVDVYDEPFGGPEHRAGQDGTFEADGETWCSRTALSSRTGLSLGAIINRLGTSRRRQARLRNGRVADFFALTDVVSACGGLLNDVPKAKSDGTFEADGERWSSVRGLKRLLGIFNVEPRLKDCRRREGKDPSGRPQVFFSVKDAETACADLLVDLPRADRQGRFEADGETWVTFQALVNILGVGKIALRVRLSSCRIRQGKGTRGRVCVFYSLADARKLCADQLETLPVSNEEGTFSADGEVWGTLRALARLLGVSQTATTGFGRPAVCRSRRGRISTGHIHTFYALSDMENALSRHAKNIPLELNKT